MSKSLAVLVLTTFTLSACATTPESPSLMTKAAPIVDLASPSAKPPAAAISAEPAPALAPTPSPAPVAETLSPPPPAAEPIAVVTPPAQLQSAASLNPALSRSIEIAQAETGRGAYLPGDGPEANIPPNLGDTPEVMPKVEPLNRFANRPYTVMGTNYVPLETPGNYKQRGIASWYGKKFHGQKTSVGEIYNMYGMTAAHPTLPIPSYARVTNLANNKSVIVRVNDRGPFLHGRIIDLSYTAAHKLGILNHGSAEVEVESLSAEDNGGARTEVAAAPNPVKSAPLPPVVLAKTAPALALTPTKTPPVIHTPSDGNIYLQLGAFKSTEGADEVLAAMRSKLPESAQALSIVNADGFARVLLGPYANLQEARSSSEQLTPSLGFKPLIKNNIIKSTLPQPAPVAALAHPAVSASTAAPSIKVAASGNVYLQLGAFTLPQSAEEFMLAMHNKLPDSDPLSVVNTEGFARVQVGPYPSVEEARLVSERLKNTLGFKPLLRVNAAKSEAPVVNSAPAPTASKVLVLSMAPSPTLPVAEVIAPPPTPVYLQLGAFSSQQSAEQFLLSLRSKLPDSEQSLRLLNQDGLARVQLGPYPSADEARSASERLQTTLGFKPLISKH